MTICSGLRAVPLGVRQNMPLAWRAAGAIRARTMTAQRWTTGSMLSPGRGGAPGAARTLGRPAPAHGLARALVAQPRALLLDEPFAALDPVLRITLRAELDALQRRLQVPMVLITHDPQDVEVFGGQVLHMRSKIESQECMQATSAA